MHRKAVTAKRPMRERDLGEDGRRGKGLEEVGFGEYAMHWDVGSVGLWEDLT